jgi:adenylate cyclase
VKYYSLGIKVLQALVRSKAQNEPIIFDTHTRFGVGPYIFPKYTGNTAFINYYGPAGTFPVYSLDTVLDDEKFTTLSEQEFGSDLNTFNEYLSQKTFQDKIVLVGATVQELHDLFPTPFYNFEKVKRLTSGVEIHANFLEMVLHQDFITRSNLLYFLIGLLVFIIFINFIFNLFKPSLNAVLSILLIGGYFYFIFHLFSARNILINVTEVPTAVLLSFLGNLVHQYYIGRKEKRFIKNAFQHYVAKDIVDEIVKNPKKLKFGGQSQELTVLFSDIRAFTTFSEKHEAKKVVETLREYLTAMVDIIKENKGTVDKFVGDEIMALFGVPYYYENHAYNACKTALMMADKLRELQRKWKKEGRELLNMGIGIHTGKAIVGNLGSEQIFDYTAIGDTVNIGARIQPLNKEYKTENHIIISGVTYEIVKDKVVAKFLDSKILRGKGTPIKLYELIRLK